MAPAGVQHVRGRHPSVKLMVGCTVACQATVRGALSIKQHRHYLTLTTAHVSVAAHSTRQVSLRLSRGKVKAILTALAHRRVTITVRITAQAGTASKRFSVKIRLRR